MADPLFNAGDAVMAFSQDLVFPATVRWRQARPCPECGTPVYRCWIGDDEEIEGDLCESVLAKATMH